MATFDGHKNHDYWNVALWINNDEGLYDMARRAVRQARDKDHAARQLLSALKFLGDKRTPDGAPYTLGAIRAALSDLDS